MQPPSCTAPITPEEARAWAAIWRRASPALERTRRDELRAVSTDVAIEHLAPLFADALKLPPRMTSGLVEQQRLFATVFG